MFNLTSSQQLLLAREIFQTNQTNIQAMTKLHTKTYGTFPETDISRPGKWMVGRLVYFWDGLFSGAMLVLGSVCSHQNISRTIEVLPSVRPCTSIHKNMSSQAGFQHISRRAAGNTVEQFTIKKHMFTRSPRNKVTIYDNISYVGKVITALYQFPIPKFEMKKKHPQLVGVYTNQP